MQSIFITCYSFSISILNALVVKHELCENLAQLFGGFYKRFGGYYKRFGGFINGLVDFINGLVDFINGLVDCINGGTKSNAKYQREEVLSLKQIMIYLTIFVRSILFYVDI